LYRESFSLLTKRLGALAKQGVVLPPHKGLLWVLFGLLSVLPFAPALGGPFFWDDNDLILDNPYVKSFAYVGHWFSHGCFDTGDPSAIGRVAYFRPLVLASYAVDWHLGSGNPAVFHATNLILAAATTMVTIAAFMRWTRSCWGACLAALILAWHPTRAESVAWISGRTDVLVTLFILLACQARSLRKRYSRMSVALEILATAGAYLCKETAIVFPAFIAFEAWVESEARTLNRATLVPALRHATSHMLAAIGYLIIRWRWLPIVPKPEPGAVAQSLASHTLLVFETFGRTLQVSFWPSVQKAQHGLLALDNHGYPQINSAYAVFGAVALVAGVPLILAARRSLPVVAWGLMLFSFAWLPTSNIVPNRLACMFFERFLFLPALGLALAMLVLMTTLFRRVTGRVVVVALLLPLLGVEYSKCFARSLDYANPVRFWNHELSVNPLSTVAPMGLVASIRSRSKIGHALRWLNQCHENAHVRRQWGDAARCVFDGAVLVSDVTLDLEQTSLESAAGFFRAAADPHLSHAAVLATHDTSLSIDLTNPVQLAAIQSLHGMSLAMLAAIESRIADFRSADDARAAIALCPLCAYVARAATALAASGHADESLDVLQMQLQAGASPDTVATLKRVTEFAGWRQRAASSEGPAKIHAQAQAYLSIGLYGAAYRVLQPHRGEFESIPSVSRDFAYIAFNAGDEAAARAALLQHATANDAAAQLGQWTVQRNATTRNE
jgi:hypothetical protein